jgi:hypothetical protein
MVPLSDKRHRLHGHEIPEAIEGLRLRLEKLVEAREDPERAEITYRALHRLMHKGPGRPKYPQFDWRYLDHFLTFFDKVVKSDDLE